MGKSVEWRVTTNAGERVVRVQSALHSGRVRLFVDETLVWQRDYAAPLWDESFEHVFQLDDKEYLLTSIAAIPRLVLQSQELSPFD